jgi:hypothetical protein
MNGRKPELGREILPVDMYMRRLIILVAEKIKPIRTYP